MIFFSLPFSLTSTILDTIDLITGATMGPNAANAPPKNKHNFMPSSYGLL